MPKYTANVSVFTNIPLLYKLLQEHIKREKLTNTQTPNTLQSIPLGIKYW